MKIDAKNIRHQCYLFSYQFILLWTDILLLGEAGYISHFWGSFKKCWSNELLLPEINNETNDIYEISLLNFLFLLELTR